MKINKLGWNEYFNSDFQKYAGRELIPGRVVSENRHIYEIEAEEGSFSASISGNFKYTAAVKSDYPVTGDWVLFRHQDNVSIIEKVLERKTSFSRKAPGSDWEEQILVANIDYLCIVNALDGGRNFNIRGIERFLTLTAAGGAMPIIILNKCDLAENPEKILLEAKTAFPNIETFTVSASKGIGLKNLKNFFCEGNTIAFVGPSGVGKSTLVNALSNKENQQTMDVREDDKRGRHTTTSRELFFIPGDIMVIDTPGLREMQIWADESDLNKAFSDISNIGKSCRFKNCTHTNEPGCAVLDMLKNGDIESRRYENYLAMREEISYLQSKLSEKGKLEKKAKDKNLAKLIKEVKKVKQ